MTGPVVAIWPPGLLSPSRPSHDPVATCLPETSSPSRPVQDPVVICPNPVPTLTRVSQTMTSHTHQWDGTKVMSDLESVDEVAL
ncbi:hypothetical protein Taro_050188, partial [Colocasia esculenta]|nr:hypothetical protein [Colocasia esculenta]